MSKEWIPTSQIEPADLEGRTVTARIGGSLMFVAFLRLTGWYWIYPGGMQEISEPPELLLEPGWARAHSRRTTPVIRTEKPGIRRRKTDQLVLDL
jgi:hypothetical protein